MKTYQIWKDPNSWNNALIEGDATRDPQTYFLDEYKLVKEFDAPDWKAAKEIHKKWQEKLWRKK